MIVAGYHGISIELILTKSQAIQCLFYLSSHDHYVHILVFKGVQCLPFIMLSLSPLHRWAEALREISGRLAEMPAGLCVELNCLV